MTQEKLLLQVVTTFFISTTYLKEQIIIKKNNNLYMKKIFSCLVLLFAFTACVNNSSIDQKKDSATQQKKGLLFQPSAIKVPYDSAYVDVCNTVHIPVPYDSAYSYTILKPDTVVKKKKYRDGNRTIITQVPVTINTSKIAYWDSAVTTCHTDTLKGLRDSIPPAFIVTEFGAKLQGDVDSQIVALNKMGVTWVRSGLILGSYNGERDKGIDKYFANGFHVALNLTWSATKPSPFCTDTALYASKLRLFFKTYAADFIRNGGFVMCENEPMNLGYYGDAPIENYIALCRIFVRIAAEYGVQSADGCTFVEYLSMASAGSWGSRLDAKIATQAKLLAAF
jgi:hypothetical protein